ncbi:MAG: hypothetical protein HY301_04015 [Verrucomicrobia bacterium]|nr:hypothetical protein [Verrucomicrobiota bacterium]
MKPITKGICFGFATEVGVMLFAILTGSYATPVFTSPLSESGFDIPGRLLHFPSHQLFFLLFSFLHHFEDWHLSWRAQLFWLFIFQAAFWSLLWFAFLHQRLRRHRHESHAA